CARGVHSSGYYPRFDFW
nr:immunoglobulin heavy chain junction region [Macaca mulatta]